MGKKRQTKADLIMENQLLSDRVTLLSLALNDTVDGFANAVSEWNSQSGGRYELRLYRALSPSGGLVVVQFHPGWRTGGNVQVQVAYLDEYAAHLKSITPQNQDMWAERVAWNKLVSARDQIVADKEKEKKENG